jgi:tripartite-type tricarboxylate transporter receptor subunit TctC
LTLAPQAASAETYPNRSIGSSSTAARSVADKMSDTLGEQIIIESRAGAGGTVATRSVAKNAPDGYTILLTTNATLAIAPSLFQNLGYDPRRDFEPIAGSSPRRPTSSWCIRAFPPTRSPT